MIKLSDLGQVYIVCGKTDLQRNRWLATLIKEQIDLDPLDSCFVAVEMIAGHYAGISKGFGYYTKR